MGQINGPFRVVVTALCRAGKWAVTALFFNFSLLPREEVSAVTYRAGPTDFADLLTEVTALFSSLLQ